MNAHKHTRTYTHGGRKHDELPVIIASWTGGLGFGGRYDRIRLNGRKMCTTAEKIYNRRAYTQMMNNLFSICTFSRTFVCVCVVCVCVSVWVGVIFLHFPSAKLMNPPSFKLSVGVVGGDKAWKIIFNTVIYLRTTGTL